MFRIYRNCVLLVLALSVVCTIKASYTSEETDEKSKNEYSAVASIFGSTDTSKHQHVRTYDGSSPCTRSGCKFNNEPNMVAVVSNPCSSSAGCSPSQLGHNSYTGSSGYPLGYSYTNNANSAKGSSNYNQPEVNVYRPTMPIYQPSQYSYNQAINPAPYPYWNGNYKHNGYQAPRDYSKHDHSLKINSEYIETGTHTGPFQLARPGYGYGYGYGSGYGSGYNGQFNRGAVF